MNRFKMIIDYFVTNDALAAAPTGIQSTAGAVPVKNHKGEVSMMKVKVRRYMPGKRPDYAPVASSEDSEDSDFLEKFAKPINSKVHNFTADYSEESASRIIWIEKDSRLRRLTRLNRSSDDEFETTIERNRQIHDDAEILESEKTSGRNKIKLESSDCSDDEELSYGEIERRWQALKLRVQSKAEIKEEIKCEEEASNSGSAESSESECEEYSDSEDESGPRLKPIFVMKEDRETVAEKEAEALKQELAEEERKKMADARKRETLQMVEEAICWETLERKPADSTENKLEDVCTDDENDEVEFEAWKLRELKRMKRDLEEQEAVEKERLEVERIRNLTEEERRQEDMINPKVITNKAVKGKYKFLQKYYHRGAFYLDKDEDVLKRDVSAAPLDDFLDKKTLQKVLQVKRFGRSGQSKYTHLTDQDTTRFDSPWMFKKKTLLNSTKFAEKI